MLPRIGYREFISSLQQWLILSIFTHCRFDIVDLILCEIENAIIEGMPLSRQQPYAHFISHLLAHAIRYSEFLEVYEDSPTCFKEYAPFTLTDRRCGQRAIVHAQEMIPIDERERAAAEDQVLAEAEAKLPQFIFDVDRDSDSDDIEYIPPVIRSQDAEEGGSS